MTSTAYDVAVVGGGIIGLASAFQLIKRFPGTKVVVLEKEDELAWHQTGHNSGVIHSGIYYRPGSWKAQFCVRSVERIKSYCSEKEITFDECGKVILATKEDEVPRLNELLRRGVENGVPGLEMIGPERLKELEPHAFGIKALYAPKTAIVDFTKVAKAYAADFREQGGDILQGWKVDRIRNSGRMLELETCSGTIQSKGLINCAGLYADRIARMMGVLPGMRTLPFRGEYYVLKPESRRLVSGLIYPVPDPRFPFLGVHYTKRITGEVEAGPNAVLAWSREGYKRNSINFTDSLSTLTYLGFWRMAGRTWRMGIGEAHRSLMKSVFVKDLQKLIPEIRSEDIVTGGAGVRAQAVSDNGRLLDDFSIKETEDAIHVLNAPSPGATSSLSIGDYIVGIAGGKFSLKS
ncbi:L-2-hydroxyglutarate oxidase [SAR202 cluster bacterium AD-804-J14_MRT_500m]|nr:L-2-hydroxyglutarate oxidase [SAR202 cluster bacterium AD-804-J14_MRT_500m]